jgi:hypothetical protein
VIDEERLIDVLMEPADNILDLKLTWLPQPYGHGWLMGMKVSIGDILPVFKRWQHLRRLALVRQRQSYFDFKQCPSLNQVCDFILDMKCLTCLYMYDDLKDKEMIALKVEVDDWVKLHRPGFIFQIRSTNSSVDCWDSL